MRRVVVTGMGAMSSIGDDWASVQKNLAAERTGIRYMNDWDVFSDMRTRLGGPIIEPQLSPNFTRKNTRTMGRVSKFAVTAAERALADAGLLDDPSIKDGRMGVSLGSCTGSTDAVMEFCGLLSEHSLRSLNATSYLRMMSHTATVNIGLYFGLTGRVIPTASACTSGSQGLGYAYEAIRYGRQTMMLAGGAEELCPSESAVFDTLYATSVANDTPELSPRPFDTGRDGLVIGEGAGLMVLEEYESAKARGAKIHAEIVGFATNSDGVHATRPNQETMGRAMEMALEDANLSASQIGYVSAHGTATDFGDIAETQATQTVLGVDKPISSMKSYLGHSLGACGGLEAWASIEMMNSDWYHGTANLTDLDERCGDLDYIIGGGKSFSSDYVMSNNFAFGGLNTSLIFKRV